MHIIKSQYNYKLGLFDFDFDPEWLVGVDYLTSPNKHYKSYTEYKGRPVIILPITQINHKIRNPGIPIFNDGVNGEGLSLTAKERVINIMSGFDNGSKMKPVLVYRPDNVDGCIDIFNLADGCHRLHCSIVYGFSFIPAVVYNNGELNAAGSD